MKTKKLMCAIIILESDISNGNLTLSDKGESYVSKNEVVTWIVHPDSGVESITAIPVKPDSTNVFTTGPCQLGNSKNWQGRIRTDFKRKSKDEPEQIVEEYDIKWKDSDGEEYTYDPKLKVNV